MKNVTWPVWLYVVMTKSFLKLSCYLTAWCIKKTKQKTPVTIVFSKQKITLSNSVKVITYGSAFSFKRAATQIQAVFFFSYVAITTETQKRTDEILSYSAAETNLSRCPSFSSKTSLVRDSPVDWSPITMHCSGEHTNAHQWPSRIT